MQTIKKIFAHMGFNTDNLVIPLPVEELEILHIYNKQFLTQDFLIN